jgi:DNA-binding XRE family transcriptional regulator
MVGRGAPSLRESPRQSVNQALEALRQALVREILPIPMEMENVTLGALVKQWRTVRGWSLQELGDKAGYTKAHIWLIETGRSCNPTVALVGALADAIGLPFEAVARAALVGNRKDGAPPQNTNDGAS